MYYWVQLHGWLCEHLWILGKSISEFENEHSYILSLTPTPLGTGNVCRPVGVHWKNNRSIIIHHWSHEFPGPFRPIEVQESHYRMCLLRQGKEEKIEKLFFELPLSKWVIWSKRNLIPELFTIVLRMFSSLISKCYLSNPQLPLSSMM